MEPSIDKTHADVTAGPADGGSYVPTHLRAADELAAVLTVSKALGGKLALDHVLGVAAGTVAEVVGAEGSSILLIDPETGGMSFHVTAGPGAETAKNIPLPPGAGICGHVAKSGQPLIVNDAQNDPRLYQKVDKASGITTRNILCVPLHSSKRLWGVLELINKRRGDDFAEGDLRVTDAIGAQIALALENAHLHNEIVRKERMAAIGQTVSGLAHCVKNVLNGIRLGSAVIDRSLGAGDFEKVTQGWLVVRRNNDMLSNLVLDMLSLARDSKFHPFPTDVNDLADQVCQLITSRASGRGIDIACMIDEDLPEVMTDPTHLYRCLLNLVSNAVEACDEGGRVSVRVHHGDGRDRFTISVADTGGGISPENVKKLFTEFFTTKGSKGTGLGLPVTRKLINMMGGTITFHSVLGKGTKFVIAMSVDGATTSGKEKTHNRRRKDSYRR